MNGGLRYEFTTMPEENYGRDSALPDLTASAPIVGPLYENPTYTNLSPRVGFAWDVFGDGRTAVRGGYGLYFNTNNHQNLIVTVTNPPFTPRPVIVNPTFPNPPFDRAGADLDAAGPVRSGQPARARLQRQRAAGGLGAHRGHGRLRRLARHAPAAQRRRQPRAADRHRPDGRPFIAAGTPRPNTAFSTIELKSSDGDSWYNAFIFDVRRRWSQGLSLQSSYTFSKSEDTTQASTFFSDATNGTTSALPEFIPGYNKGPSDFDIRHNWVLNFTWELPSARDLTGAAGGASRRLAGLGHLDHAQRQSADGVRHHQPVALAVEPVARARHRPGSARLRAGLRSRTTPCSAGPSSGSTRRRSCCSPPARSATPAAATSSARTSGRSTSALSKSSPWARARRRRPVEFRLEAFNVLNRTNFGVPELRAFAGTDGQPALATFGRISNTVTSSRQIQLGVRVVF